MIAFGPRGRQVTMFMVISVTFLGMVGRSILLLSLMVPVFWHVAPSSWGTQRAATLPQKMLVGGALELLMLPFAFVEQFKKLKILSVITQRLIF